MILLQFKESMEFFFRDMDAVMKHRQVVLLICGLMSDPTPIIHLVFAHWINDGQKSVGKTLIEAMFREAGLKMPKDLLHNQWINYYDHNEGLLRDRTPIYVPSRLYWFKDMEAKVSCNIQHGNTEKPECTISINFPHVIVTKNLLSTLHRICKHQAIRDLNMWGVKCEDLQEPHVFTLSKNAESLRIMLCELPLETMSHLMQQINRCNLLHVLCISNTDLMGFLSGFLLDPHP